jgi:hypothetical protein
MIFATSQEGKKQHAEDATSVNVHFVFSPVRFPVEGVKYEDCACCEIGSNVPSEMCPNEIDTSNEIDTTLIGIIVGSSIASLCVICCCGCFFLQEVLQAGDKHTRESYLGLRSFCPSSCDF